MSDKDTDLEKLSREFKEASDLLDADKLWDKTPISVKDDGEFIKVVEIPIAWTADAWRLLDLLVAKGYTIKGVLEREYWKTSLIILECVRKDDVSKAV